MDSRYQNINVRDASDADMPAISKADFGAAALPKSGSRP